MGLFFEKTNKQSKFQRFLINIIIVYLIVSAINSFILKFDWLNSIMSVADIVLIAIIFIWLVFFVKNEKHEK